MYVSLIILCLSLTIFSCNATTLDYSNIAPWSVVYSIYPVYASEPHIKVWKIEDTNTLNNHKGLVLNWQKNKEINDNLQKNDDNNDDVDQQLNINQSPQTYPWSVNYRKWQNNSNKVEQ